MKHGLLRLPADLLWMMYPVLCAACSRPLFTGEDCVCTICNYQLPKTDFHLQPENPVARQFWGKVRIRNASAYYHFTKGEKVQTLIHNLKYKGRKDVGIFIGRQMGYDLLKAGFNDVDVIVPVPLHESKQRQRGYNQSDCFAEGLSVGLKTEYKTDVLIRQEATSTQTRKGRFERYINVDSVFKVSGKADIANRKILLVDDVITTGSTLISCAEAMLAVTGVTVDIAAIAYA